MHIHRLSLLSVALLAAACTPPHIGRNGDASVDRTEVSGSGGAAGGGAGGSAGSGGAPGSGGSCGTPSIEGSGCGTPAQFNFDTNIGQTAGLQGWTGQGTGFTSVSGLRTWCTHTWCGNGAMTFDCNLNTSAGTPGQNECAVQVTTQAAPALTTVTSNSVITFGLKAAGLNASANGWLRVFVTLIDQTGYSGPIFAGTARVDSWYQYTEAGSTLFSADLKGALNGSGQPVTYPLKGLEIYVDVNEVVTWTGTIWIDEIGWK